MRIVTLNTKRLPMHKVPKPETLTKTPKSTLSERFEFPFTGDYRRLFEHTSLYDKSERFKPNFILWKSFSVVFKHTSYFVFIKVS